MNSEIKPAKDRMPTDKPFDPFELACCYTQEVAELRAALEASQNEVMRLQKEVKHWKANHSDLKERLHVATHRTDLPSDRLPLFDEYERKIAHQQYLIDSLMIEYCPDEMTEEQWENWKAHQRRVTL